MAKGSHPELQTTGGIIAKLIVCLGIPFALFIYMILKIILEVLS